MQGQFEVDPGELVAAAGRLAELAARVSAQSAAVRGSGASAAGAAGNPVAAGAINAVAASWGDALQQISAALERDASSLRQVAQRYVEADEAGAATAQRGLGR